jgi:hypothetical protein
MLAATTYLFNWPRFFVPPPLRSEPCFLRGVLHRRRMRT